MLSIIQALDARKQQLRHSRLCTLIDNPSIPPESRLNFTPAMLFFVMGFKDILYTMKDDKSTDPMQQSVNVHCEEDSYHWQWYLKDLERLQEGQRFLEQPGTAMFTQVWSDEYSAVRNVVYETIHLARQFSSPFYKLIIIEALEATFECFNEPVFKLVHEMGRQNELEYFGQLHAHSEANHAMDKTTGEQESAAYNNYQPGTHETDNALFIINKIFDLFEKAFDCWYQVARLQGKQPVAAASL